jgi:hypothetical protein
MLGSSTGRAWLGNGGPELGRTAPEGVGFRSRRSSYTASEGTATETVPTGTAATAGSYGWLADSTSTSRGATVGSGHRARP